MYIFTNISRNKDNPGIKFGQLIEYNMRNIRIQNHVQNMVEKLNRAYLWINNLKFYTVRFYCMQVEDCPNILKLSCRPLAFTSYKALSKTNRSLELVSLPHFLHDF